MILTINSTHNKN